MNGLALHPGLAWGASISKPQTIVVFALGQIGAQKLHSSHYPTERKMTAFWTIYWVLANQQWNLELTFLFQNLATFYTEKLAASAIWWCPMADDVTYRSGNAVVEIHDVVYTFRPRSGVFN